MTASGRSSAFDSPASQSLRELYRGLGSLVLRPWFDGLALRSVAGWYFPLSRGWAAALAAEGDLERFRDALPGAGPFDRRVAPALSIVRSRGRAYEAAAAAWEDGVFGAQSRRESRRALLERTALEQARHRAANRHMSTRLALLPVKRQLPPVRWEVAPPGEVERRHGARLARPEAAFPLPVMPPVELSAPVLAGYGEDRWLRFPSPVQADTAWARVQTPREPRDPPTLIFLHGIAMETEMWAGLISLTEPLVRRGLRVIAAEGPWHGRRRAAGYYGGEPVIGRGPLGLLDIFQSWVAEVAVLIDWARRTGGGPVVLGGVSLGALAAQRAACAGRYWPAALRPDLLFLVATSGDLLELAQDGSLARAVGLNEAILAQGWDDADFARWLPLLQPDPEAPLPPDRVIMLLGRADDLTPFGGGHALAESWGVPAENLFLRDQGHFSVSLGVLSDQAPLDRLCALLGSLR